MSYAAAMRNILGFAPPPLVRGLSFISLFLSL